MANFELISRLAHDTGGKIILLVMDGLGGLPQTPDGLTELETAKTPNMDALAKAPQVHNRRRTGILAGAAVMLIAAFVIVLAAINRPPSTPGTITPSDSPTATVDANATRSAEMTATLLALSGYPNGNPVTANSQWTPVTQPFDGVDMVLVPKGCFEMGSTTGNGDEQPVNQVCFDTPFWIDRTEVTNAQYGSSGLFSGEERPRERVNWYDAKRFCERRGARLPTEAEWEYAARGPDNLVYPWGNDFAADNLVYSANSNDQTAPVGSKPGGVSWVGALDMIGNVWEWVSTIYDEDDFPYPYATDDGREDLNTTEFLRGVRGGSWDSNSDGLRAAYRDWVNPLNPVSYVGFRCARTYS